MDPWSEESHLGPPSDQLNIPQFVEQAKGAGLLDGDNAFKDVLMNMWLSFPEHERVAIEGECSVKDLAAQSAEQFSDPAFRASLGIWQDECMLEILESNVLALDKGCKDWMRKASVRAEKRRAAGDIDCGRTFAAAEQQAIREQLDEIKLESWGFDVDAVHYVIRPAAESVNTLVEIKEACYQTPHNIGDANDVLLTISVFRYNHNRAAPTLRLGAKHVFLASHTLGDLLDILSCPSNDVPLEVVDEHGNVLEYETDIKMDSGACVLGLEAPTGVPDTTKDIIPNLDAGLIFGDGMSDKDYAE
ncbi:hypothetical protein FRB96_000884 [Tulasnella sp. 330]|nr:hypothetical protein FRB96_000884 [Tulasnella sp. 330]